MLQSQLSPHELAYQESLIHEREQEIREIETGIHELAEIFHDLGTLVNQQGGMLGIFACDLIPTFANCVSQKDNVESNIQVVATDTGAAAEQLRIASDYQRKAGRKAACLMLIIVIVVAVVLVAVGFSSRDVARAKEH